jgi:hypothetical protein
MGDDRNENTAVWNMCCPPFGTEKKGTTSPRLENVHDDEPLFVPIRKQT